MLNFRLSPQRPGAGVHFLIESRIAFGATPMKGFPAGIVPEHVPLSPLVSVDIQAPRLPLSHCVVEHLEFDLKFNGTHTGIRINRLG